MVLRPVPAMSLVKEAIPVQVDRHVMAHKPVTEALLAVVLHVMEGLHAVVLLAMVVLLAKVTPTVGAVAQV